MFKFLKTLFKKPEPQELELAELGKWFNSQFDEKVKWLGDSIKEFHSTIENSLSELKQKREQLLEAPLKDEDKIEPRIKQIVLGHRENYSRELKIFVDDIAMPDNVDLDAAIEFNELVKKQLDEFAQATAKSFSAASHLFFEQTDAIKELLKAMHEASAKFDKIVEKEGIAGMREIQKLIGGIGKEIDNKKKLEEELASKESRLEGAVKSKQSYEANIAAIKESDGYKHYQSLLNDKAALNTQLRGKERDVRELFLELERPLRKFEHIALERMDVIARYLEDAFGALMADGELDVWDVLVDMNKKLDQLDLKEEQLEKVKDRLWRLTREKLEELRESCLKLADELNATEKKIENDLTITKLKEEEYKLDHFEQQVGRLNGEISETKKSLEGIDILSSIKRVEEKINDVMGQVVVIKSEL